MPNETDGAITLRPARPDDIDAMREICIVTAHAGGDARGIEDAPDLLPVVFAEPYLVFAPDCAFVVEDDEGVCGYVIGVPDSAGFDAWAAAEWYPPLRGRVADPGADPAGWSRPSDWLRAWIHRPVPSPASLLADWPAHLHIDLLPRAQGRGVARAMMERLFAALAAAGAPGVHLGVQPANARALRFYEKLGFAPSGLPGDPRTTYLVRSLAPT